MNRSQLSALDCRATLLIPLEKQQFSAGGYQANFLVTDAHLRMGLTQHTVRSGAAIYLSEFAKEIDGVHFWTSGGTVLF